MSDFTGPLNDLAARINKNATDKGFWESDRNMGEMIALAHSELSEALEAHRKCLPTLYRIVVGEAEHHDGRPHGICEHAEPRGNCDQFGGTSKPEGIAAEFADVIIRVLDTMQSLGVDIDAVVTEKMTYNESRPYKHGKAY